MSKYTPSTDMVRAKYRYPGESSVEDAEFNRWLNLVKADAWDHAIEHVSQIEADVGFMEHYKRHNPYRKQEEA